MKTEQIDVKVTQKDIKNAINEYKESKDIYSCCPVAQVLKRLRFLDVEVGHTSWSLWKGKKVLAKLRMEGALAYTKAFPSEWLNLKPGKIRLEVPSK